MRTLTGAAIVALLVVATGIANAAQPPSLRDLEQGKARVRLIDSAPLTLRGVDFAPAEPVKLTVSLGERIATRKLVATRAGTFTVAFGAMRYSRCGASLDVRAIGRMGARVSWELIPLDCPTRDDT